MKNEKNRDHSWMWSTTRASTRLISAEQRAKIIQWLNENQAATDIDPRPSTETSNSAQEFWYVRSEIVLMRENPKTGNPKYLKPGDFRLESSVGLNRRLIKEGILPRKK